MNDSSRLVVSKEIDNEHYSKRNKVGLLERYYQIDYRFIDYEYI